VAKADLLKRAQAAGLASDDAKADDYTEDELRALLDTDKPAWEGSLSDASIMEAPDGHKVR
jgi:hypothetical protein